MWAPGDAANDTRRWLDGPGAEKTIDWLCPAEYTCTRIHHARFKAVPLSWNPFTDKYFVMVTITGTVVVATGGTLPVDDEVLAVYSKESGRWVLDYVTTNFLTSTEHSSLYTPHTPDNDRGGSSWDW